MSELSLEQALAELPDTADGIAAYLTEQDCRGKRENGNCCPLANYLARNSQFRDPFVDTSYVRARLDGDRWGHMVDTPEHIREFVLGFDRGKWPDLDIEVTPDA